MQPAYLRVSVRVRAHVRVDGRNGRWDEGKGVGSLQDNLGGVCVCACALEANVHTMSVCH